MFSFERVGHAEGCLTYMSRRRCFFQTGGSLTEADGGGRMFRPQKWMQEGGNRCHVHPSIGQRPAWICRRWKYDKWVTEARAEWGSILHVHYSSCSPLFSFLRLSLSAWGERLGTINLHYTHCEHRSRNIAATLPGYRASSSFYVACDSFISVDSIYI